MPKNPSSHNIYSGSKSKMVFQSPDDNLDKFDYINEVEEKENNADKDALGIGANLGVKILEKLFGFLVKKNKPRQDSGQDSDF